MRVGGVGWGDDDAMRALGGTRTARQPTQNEAHQRRHAARPEKGGDVLEQVQRLLLVHVGLDAEAQVLLLCLIVGACVEHVAER